MVPTKDKLAKVVEKVKKDFEDFENFIEEGFEEADEKGNMLGNKEMNNDCFELSALVFVYICNPYRTYDLGYNYITHQSQIIFLSFIVYFYNSSFLRVVISKLTLNLSDFFFLAFDSDDKRI